MVPWPSLRFTTNRGLRNPEFRWWLPTHCLSAPGELAKQNQLSGVDAMATDFGTAQEPSVWLDEISEEELLFLEQFMPEQLEAMARELEQDPVILALASSMNDRLQLKQAA